MWHNFNCKATVFIYASKEAATDFVEGISANAIFHQSALMLEAGKYRVNSRVI